MTPVERLRTLRRAAVQRRVAGVLACVLPPLAAVVAIAAARAPAAFAIAVTLVAVLVAAGLAAYAASRIDAAWLARALDAAMPAMEDSSALLASEAALTRVQALQRERLAARLAAQTPDLREPWPARAIGLACAGALSILALGVGWPARTPAPDAASTPAAVPAQATATRTVQAELAIEPPAYTGLPAKREGALDAKAAEGSELRWRLRFDPQPVGASLAFHDGTRLALVREGEDWRANRRLEASMLYRIALDGAPPPEDDRLHRLDAIADRAPEVRVVRPERSLSLVEAGQRQWPLEFEVDDDYAIAGAALRLTLAQGSGENVTFREHVSTPLAEAIDGARRQRYREVIDLAALGVAAGDDVIVRLEVRDNREPEPNTTRSPSFILRWPADASADSAGLEGVVQHVLPAYFRSQRQIIIDSEALVAEQPALDAAKFLARSDALGVDQRVLRLRYGQFLGEEAEDGQAHGAAGETSAADADDHEDGDAASARTEPPHDHAAPARFGDADGVVAEYGHVHDIAEAATLLDPQTKEILRAALAEMWQSELHLRQGEPGLALPYEYRALDLIKRVQQSTRIYLARVGLELPAPDESRRLGGDREGLLDRTGSLAAMPVEAQPLLALWQALDAGGEPDWDAAERWIASNRQHLSDPLGVIAAIDRSRREPACGDCRARLRGLLWPALPAPAAAATPRAAADAVGRAYLDALQSAEGTR